MSHPGADIGAAISARLAAEKRQQENPSPDDHVRFDDRVRPLMRADPPEPDPMDEDYWSALLAQADPANEQPPSTVLDSYPVLDWHAAFAAQPEAIEWLAELFLERGKSYAVYSPAKVGKSLLLQDVCAALAAGRPVFGQPARDPVTVLYVDMENAVTDIVERMTAYGYGPADLDRLRYLSFPDLPPLDTANGGAHLLGLVDQHDPGVVVIDTLSRVISGNENDNDPYHAFYRHTIAPLKAAGVTVVRLDHAGKDPTRGQRGGSAKSTDVDVVWRLDLDGQKGVTLTREACRNTHHPERIHLRRQHDPFRHELASGPVLAVGTTDAIANLDRLGVPLNAGRDVCRTALVQAGIKVSNDTLAAAIRHRKTPPHEANE